MDEKKAMGLDDNEDTQEVKRLRFLEKGKKDLYEDLTATRRMLAVPFVGKGVPARVSEFASPEMMIGMTVLAYHVEGLRVSDVKGLVRYFSDKLNDQLGNMKTRSARIEFENFLQDEKERLQTEAKQKFEQLQAEATDETDPAYKKAKAALEKAIKRQPIPLELLNSDDETQMEFTKIFLEKSLDAMEVSVRQPI